jgi:hypothetical protein
MVLIGLIFAYSYFFYVPDGPYSFACEYKNLVGHNCPSCGFSRAFAAFVKFNFDEGMSYNPQAFKVFLFFVVQFFLRILFLLLRFKHQVMIDISFSISYFLYAFGSLLVF